MASCKMAGDELVVTRGKKSLHLSLAVPLDRLSLWLDLDSDAGFWEAHEAIRDSIMPDSVRAVIEEIEREDAIEAVHVGAEWSRAIGERLGKALSLSSSGVITVQPSPETSGSDTESSSTE